MTPQGMKTFSIEGWKAGGKPVCRDGYEPTDLHYFQKSKSLYKQLFFTDSSGLPIGISADGQFIDGQSPHDLFLKAEKKEGWVALKNNIIYCQTIFDTIEELRKRESEFGPNVVFAKIEWYE